MLRGTIMLPKRQSKWEKDQRRYWRNKQRINRLAMVLDSVLAVKLLVLGSAFVL